MTIAELIQEWVRCETWRPISWAPNYSVSSWGRVQGPRVMLQPSMTAGYLVVSIVVEGRTKSSRVHKLVANAFLGDAPFDSALVAHNDGITENCRIDNLRWASSGENQNDRIRHGTRVRGSDVAGSKLKESDIPAIRDRINAGERYPSIADDFGVSVSTISLIKKNKVWRCATGAAWRPQ